MAKRVSSVRVAEFVVHLMWILGKGLTIVSTVTSGLNTSVDCPSESWELPVPLYNFGRSKSDCRSAASCRDQPCLAGESCECTPTCGLRCETICPTVEPTFNMLGRRSGPCGQPKCQPGLKCIHRFKECLCVAGCGHRCLVRLHSEPARTQIAKKAAGTATFSTAGNNVERTGEAESPRSPRWSVCNLYKHRRVCGSDGNTYRTLCDFRDRRKGDVYVQHRGSCHAKPSLSGVHDGTRFGCNTTLQRGDLLNFTDSAATELVRHLCEDPRPCETNSDCTGKDEICLCVTLTHHEQAAVEDEQETTQPPESSTSFDIPATNPHLNLTGTLTTGSPQTTA
ncbi:uncharacterized protein LOC117294699 [Asterias rubens]|uniref:uncharacterized protein LOC117294699 n=1 Tax=Asterias rubens TaxID=7604 RepID=UPI001454FBDC|nr:uncharacterized protein LOC117294699 [Asterias rubens]